MTAASTTPARFTPPRRFDNAAEWLESLGGVPLERIIFAPWPGTATEADLLQFVERDKRLCELIDGTLVEKPVGFWKGVIGANVGGALKSFVMARRLGSVTGASGTIRLRPGRVCLPDIAFVSTSRLANPAVSIPDVAPELAVIVRTDNNTDQELHLKLGEYFEAGTRLAWIIDPRQRTVAVYHRADAPARVLAETETLEGEHVLPGFSLPVADVFRNVPRD